MAKLFVGGLPPNSTEDEVKEIFEPFGPITRCDMKGGFCFIEFGDERDAEDVLKKADEFKLGGNNLKVERSRGGDRGGGGGGDRGGRGGGNGGDKGCFKCGKLGHFARNCEEGGDGDGHRGGGRGGRRGGGRGRGGDRGGRRDGGGRGRGGRGGDRGGRRGGGGRGRRDD